MKHGGSMLHLQPFVHTNRQDETKQTCLSIINLPVKILKSVLPFPIQLHAMQTLFSRFNRPDFIE